VDNGGTISPGNSLGVVDGIPEPGSLTLFALAGLLLLAVRRRSTHP